jgi:hypothetical protein
MGSRFLLTPVLLLCCCAIAQNPPCPEPVTHLIIDKGQYLPAQGAVFILQSFRADLVSHSNKQPACSLRITQIDHGEVLITADSLTNFFNRKIEKSDSKIGEVKVEIKEGNLHLKGKVHKGVSIPFEVEGPVFTDGKNLILQAKKIKSAGLPMKGLLDLLGVHLTSLINSGQVNGVVANGDKLIFEPLKIANVQGRISRVNVTGNTLDISFGHPPAKKIASNTTQTETANKRNH